jgi:hypothetical protein
MLGILVKSVAFVGSAAITGYVAHTLMRTKLSRCYDACAAGGRVLEDFCRSLRSASQRAGCWAELPEGEQHCRNWCYSQFGR